MEEDIVIIEADGTQRNALIVDRRGGNRPPFGMGGNRWPAPPVRPTYYPQAPTYAPTVYHPPAPPAAAPAAASSMAGLKSWIPDIVHIAASLAPLPVPPVSTGDPAKDFNNGMQFAMASLASLKRTDLLHTVARIAERRL